jgi:hypothetical protein
MRVVGLVIGGLLVVGVVNSAMSGDNQAQATGSQPKAAAPAPKPEAKPAPKPEAPSSEQQFISWWSETESDFQEFIDDNLETGQYFSDHAEEIAADPEVAQMKVQKLNADIVALRNHGPVPMKSIDQPWQKMLDKAESGYQNVLWGLETMDADLLSQGVDDVKQATEYMDEVSAAAAAYPR